MNLNCASIVHCSSELYPNGIPVLCTTAPTQHMCLIFLHFRQMPSVIHAPFKLLSDACWNASVCTVLAHWVNLSVLTDWSMCYTNWHCVQLIETSGTPTQFLDASNRFYTLIPHDFGMKKPPLLDTADAIRVCAWIVMCCSCFEELLAVVWP